MTTQFGDVLVEGSISFKVKTFPLNQLGGSWHGERVDGSYQSRFAPMSTACWRRYIAEWAIIENKLVLTGINARDEAGNQLSVMDIFGMELLPAFWFSGELKSPMGKRIHGVFEPIFEKDNVWVFERGALLRKYIRENVVPTQDVLNARRQQERNALPPFVPRIADLLDTVEIDGGYDRLSEPNMEDIEKVLDAAMNNIVTIKQTFIPGYDSEHDPEYDAVRDAWQHLTHQDHENSAIERVERARKRLAL